MRTKVLFLVAMFFLAIAIFSCKKDVETTNVSIKEQSFICPFEKSEFSINTAANGKLNWKIDNLGTFNQTYWLVARSYNNGIEVEAQHSMGQYVPTWGTKTVNILQSNHPYGRVFSMYVSDAQSLYYCQSGGLKCSPLQIERKAGYWIIKGTITNGEKTQALPKWQLIIDCKLNGVKKLSTPIRISPEGIQLHANYSFMCILEDQAINGANTFTARFENSYPNKK